MTNLELKEYIGEIQKDYKFNKVILFGSRAAGTNRDDSDIDLLVEFSKNKKSLFTIAGMINDIEDKFDLKVDIVPYPVPNTIAGLKLNINEKELLYG